ncbi:hypothetical protein [uncultured Pseudoteredinibacter sp.]|uniref:hypothetical protein n=1 Tax=uncultured Pseudoteredinibacter sp. TaxID=1641701 RepID=UPI00263709C9|nr:hypothetical protein [uncultured Pseudoteredinibacter sp.]
MDINQGIKAFRRGMLKIKEEGYSFSYLDQFPNECCEFSSYLLAKYLIEEHGLLNVEMLRGKNRFKHKQRHIWLRSGDKDIDIAANQFSSTDKTVFFEAFSEWHKRYCIYEVEKPDPSFDRFQEECRAQLLKDYERILCHVIP